MSLPDLSEFIKGLERDGLHISRETASEHSIEKAEFYIRRLGYYRFRTYYEPFRRLLASGTTGIGLNDVLKLNKFDRRLRLLSLDAFERIEQSLKSDLYHHFVDCLGEDWIEVERATSGVPFKLRRSIKSALFQGPEWRGLRWEDLDSADKHSIIDKLRFSDSIQLFRVLEERFPQRQQDIAQLYGVVPRVLSVWLNRIRYVRNVAAHHSRLWNISTGTLPKIISPIYFHFGEISPPSGYRSRYFGTALISCFLLRQIARNTKWPHRLKDLLQDSDLRPKHLNLELNMGFPKDWHMMPYWELGQDARSIKKRKKGVRTPTQL